MRKLYSIACRPQVLVLLCVLALSLAAVNPPPLITQLRESVVTIYGYDRDGNRSMGTGWLISDRQVVTCFHVVDGNQRLETLWAINCVKY